MINGRVGKCGIVVVMGAWCCVLAHRVCIHAQAFFPRQPVLYCIQYKITDLQGTTRMYYVCLLSVIEAR